MRDTTKGVICMFLGTAILVVTFLWSDYQINKSLDSLTNAQRNLSADIDQIASDCFK